MAAEVEGESSPAVVPEAPVSEAESTPEPVFEEEAEEPAVEETASVERDYASMTVEEKAYYSLLDSGALEKWSWQSIHLRWNPNSIDLFLCWSEFIVTHIWIE